MVAVAPFRLVAATFLVSCASTPDAGPLGEGAALRPPVITAIDTAHPPQSAWVQLGQPGHVALLLVAPGHSATLLYPRDQFTSNELTAGAHLLTFDIPELLVAADSVRDAQRAAGRQRMDSIGRARARRRTSTSEATTVPLSPVVPTYLLAVTSRQPLV